ncbi:MAG: hypothetical protein LBI06_02655 [Treponema sp.]|nr:hypothetical protein [Treponema sp.]
MIISISPSTLGTIVIVIAIEVVGIVQFLKNFLPVHFGKGYAIVSLLVTAGCSVMNTSLVPPLATAIFDITFLSLAVVQLAYETVANAIPALVEKAMSGTKIIGSQISEGEK